MAHHAVVRSFFLAILFLAVFATIPTAHADCNGQIAVYEGWGRCPDGISCESQYCYYNGCASCTCGSYCPCTSCACSNVRCECFGDGMVVTTAICWTNDCNRCNVALNFDNNRRIATRRGCEPTRLRDLRDIVGDSSGRSR